MLNKQLTKTTYTMTEYITTVVVLDVSKEEKRNVEWREHFILNSNLYEQDKIYLYPHLDEGYVQMTLYSEFGVESVEVDYCNREVFVTHKVK